MNGSETLDRIQQEIKEALVREEELKNVNNTTINNNNINKYVKNNGEVRSNSPINGILPTQNGRRFAPNPSTKGVMHKFFKMRGKLNIVNNMKSAGASKTWTLPDFEPAKVTIEPGKPPRNGYVPAEEKMRRELREFQQREAELRKERRKSQPDLMAAIEAEEIPLKPARSMAQLYSLSGEESSETSSGPPSLRPAKSLAELCEIDDDLPGTHSLIRQFESLKEESRIY